MLGLLVVSHGSFADELVKATRTIIGDIEALEAVSIGWDEEPDRARQAIEQAVRRVDRGSGVLMFTDMFGGTPTNLALSMLEENAVEIVTGVNLPMLIKFTNLRGELPLHDAAAIIAEEGREAIQVATQLLEARREHADEEHS